MNIVELDRVALRAQNQRGPSDADGVRFLQLNGAECTTYVARCFVPRINKRDRIRAAYEPALRVQIARKALFFVVM
jgi:hypothetical protein